MLDTTTDLEMPSPRRPTLKHCSSRNTHRFLDGFNISIRRAGGGGLYPRGVPQSRVLTGWRRGDLTTPSNPPRLPYAGEHSPDRRLCGDLTTLDPAPNKMNTRHR